MQKIRYGLIVLLMLACLANSASAQISVGIGLPNLSIGINLPLYPKLTPVPGYPVYYAPDVNGNYFFYDGMYWVYQNDNWYASSWYNGPWGIVEPQVVPLFILRIPVRYYRQPPPYFRGWKTNAPPRWGQHWGNDWERNRSGWNHWKRGSAPPPAPLPLYQRQYSGDRYPRVEQQHELHNQQYRYQPRDKAIRRHLKQQAGQNAPAPGKHDRREEHGAINQGQPDMRHSPPHQQGAPAAPHSQPAAAQQHEQHEQQDPRLHDLEQNQMEREKPQEPKRGHGQGQNKDEERGR